MNPEDEDPLIQTPHTPQEEEEQQDTNIRTAVCCGGGCGGGGGCCGVCSRVCTGITIEPVLFLYILAVVMMGTISTNLLLDKVCIEMAYPTEICNNLTSYTDIEAVVQQSVTTTQMYYNLITSLPSVLFALFLGSWSDKHGRKIPMILPLCGNFVSSLIFVVNAFIITLPSSYMLFAGLPVALTGGMSTLLMACFSYVSDITKVRSRTTRIAFVDLGFSIGSPVGMLIGVFLFSYMGYLGIYWAGAVCFLIAGLYTIIRIKDSKGPTQGSVGEVYATRDVSRCSRMCQDLFDTENVRKSFGIAFKQRPDKGRMKVLMLIGAMCVMVAEFGGVGLDYLYTKRVFGWTYNQYVGLSVFKLLIQLAVTSFAFPVLSYYLQVGDTVLVLVGCVAKVVGFIIMGVAPQEGFLYLSAVISSVGVFPLVVTRALISKSVPPEELGAIFSVLASFEAVIPLASSPLYTTVYNASINVFPGAVFILSAALFTVAGMMFVWVFQNRHTPDPPDTRTQHTPVHIHADEIPDLHD